MEQSRDLPSGSQGSAAMSRVGPRSSAWALAYLRGRAIAFNRGTVTQANVHGGIRLAVRCGASIEEAQNVLASHGLAWDRERHRIMRME
jgi:hypothetical protein